MSVHASLAFLSIRYTHILVKKIENRISLLYLDQLFAYWTCMFYTEFLQAQWKTSLYTGGVSQIESNKVMIRQASLLCLKFSPISPFILIIMFVPCCAIQLGCIIVCSWSFINALLPYTVDMRV